MIKRVRFGLVAALGLLILAACGTPTPPSTTRTLTVNVSGNGSVTSEPIGIDTANEQVSASFDTGTEVTLTAVADAGWQFDGWSGDCSGTGACEVTLDANASVTATFVEVEEPVTLTVNVVTGGGSAGSVTSSPAGIDTAGGASASHDFELGTEVTLTATATSGEFAGWAGGDCAGLKTLTCVVTVDEGEEAVTAAFNDVASETNLLTSQTAEELFDDSSANPTNWPAGHTYQDSSDLDFSYDSAHSTLQHFAMRFDFAELPANARIISATIEFTASASHSDPVSVVISGDASAAPSLLGNDADGAASFDLSSRTKTGSAVTWELPTFASGSDYTSVELAAVLQELVDLDGFGGSVVIIVSPPDDVDPGSTAQRSAVSYGIDFAGPGVADRPSITVEYVVLPPL